MLGFLCAARLASRQPRRRKTIKQETVVVSRQQYTSSFWNGFMLLLISQTQRRVHYTERQLPNPTRHGRQRNENDRNPFHGLRNDFYSIQRSWWSFWASQDHIQPMPSWDITLTTATHGHNTGLDHCHACGR